jgi:hypothetical protein
MSFYFYSSPQAKARGQERTLEARALERRRVYLSPRSGLRGAEQPIPRHTHRSQQAQKRRRQRRRAMTARTRAERVRPDDRVLLTRAQVCGRERRPSGEEAGARIRPLVWDRGSLRQPQP